MSGCKHSIWKTLSATATLALMLPQLALGEFGICPPYSKTFGPDDPGEDIVTFIAEANTRPGGGTLLLEPGEYELGDEHQITGTLCIRAKFPEEGQSAVGGNWTVLSGGALTLSGGVPVIQLAVSNATVETGGLLFMDETYATGLVNYGTAFARGGNVGPVENGGTLIMEDIWHPGVFENSGFASLSNFHTEGIVNSGTLVVSGSYLSDAYYCYKGDDYPPLTCDFLRSAISNSGTVEVAKSKVESCEGPVTDLGYNEFYAGGGCIVTDPTSKYYNGEVDALVRTLPYWKEPGELDLSSASALFIAVMSGGSFDPTTIVFDSIAVGDFPRSAMRGVVYHDKNGDGLPDYNFWYRLDRALVLECRDYDEPFSAMTDDGLSLIGRLQFEVVGCTP